jgi:hypothetical protein
MALLYCAATLAQRCASHADFADNGLCAEFVQRFLKGQSLRVIKESLWRL